MSSYKLKPFKIIMHQFHRINITDIICYNYIQLINFCTKLLIKKKVYSTVAYYLNQFICLGLFIVKAIIEIDYFGYTFCEYNNEDHNHRKLMQDEVNKMRKRKNIFIDHKRPIRTYIACI